jgi:hypothetical protein
MHGDTLINVVFTVYIYMNIYVCRWNRVPYYQKYGMLVMICYVSINFMVYGVLQYLLVLWLLYLWYDRFYKVVVTFVE